MIARLCLPYLLPAHADLARCVLRMGLTPPHLPCSFQVPASTVLLAQPRDPRPLHLRPAGSVLLVAAVLRAPG